MFFRRGGGDVNLRRGMMMVCSVCVTSNTSNAIVLSCDLSFLENVKRKKKECTNTFLVFILQPHPNRAQDLTWVEKNMGGERFLFVNITCPFIHRKNQCDKNICIN